MSPQQPLNAFQPDLILYQPHFLDPLGSKLPALERNILKLRALQMVLVLFYAEELKRIILDLRPVPRGSKRPVDKALSALMQDGALTSDEKIEIKSLIDYRNTIGHRMHKLVADLSNKKSVRQMHSFGSDGIKGYDYGAAERLQYFINKLYKVYKTHGGIVYLSFNNLMFEAAERTFLAEIKSLKRKIRRLDEQRSRDIKIINAELSLAGTEFESDDRHPNHPLNKYENGRLTQRGAETCYRLYDSDRSPMAVAHLMMISLRSARHRYKLWRAAGGANRPEIDLGALPKRRF